MAIDSIIVEKLEKSFPKKQKTKASFRQRFLKPRERSKVLNSISFKVKAGEIIGYIGPNGAGKSTTIKILTGILTPDSGTVKVEDMVPWEQRMQLAKSIGVVFGQKTLLWWDLSPKDIMPLYREIYEIPEAEFAKRLEELEERFGAREFISTPTRKLSLGERMRCDLIVALLHKPKVLFLDEPTIGLDAVAKEQMRNLVKKINEQEHTTIFLTTHDMNDIEELADRIIVVDKGAKIFEGKIEDFKRKYLKEAVMSFEILEIKDKSAFVSLLSQTRQLSQEGNYYELAFSTQKMSAQDAASRLFECCKTSSFQIKEPSLEEIIRDFYELH